MHHALDDLTHLNLAAVLSHQPDLDGARTSCLPRSMRISQHILAAAAKYAEVTGSKPDSEASQKNLKKALALADDKTLRALAKKLNPANPERSIGKEPALQLAKTIIANASLTTLPLNLISILICPFLIFNQYSHAAHTCTARTRASCQISVRMSLS